MVLVIFLLLLAAIASAGGYSPGLSARSLSRNFHRLGDMTGKSKSDIIQVVGAPSSISYMGHSHLLQWQARGYHVALLFNEEGIFQGVTHEYAAHR